VILDDALELVLTNSQGAGTETVKVAWRRQPLIAEKGVAAELPQGPLEAKARYVFLTAIGKALLCMDEISSGGSFAAIAQREGKSERQIRLLAPLAFLPPTTVKALIEGTAKVRGLIRKRLAQHGRPVFGIVDNHVYEVVVAYVR
jgi:hypothetical protein